ncbi:dienelactone hydrolase family protein [Sphingomonas solaris]|uniref:Dienelactone hydrolase family protein n=1 Tax=Alterirhizorhabdus solaris TaxID=2529389 RepID=A0A558RCV4_9SPHN|nr:dienelactone hydrolase family protein [Sphingomonas solaris]TVV77163.1 dienelactone hydrolase family protein [Sphingomonas solaris]
MTMPGECWTYRDGDLILRGELHRPARANGRAVLVVHEADGIGGNVRRPCARLAGVGYIAAPADMHGEGRVLAGDAMMAAVRAFRADPPLLRRRVRAAFDALCLVEGVAAGRVAAMGFCFGGTAVLELARSGTPVAAVASFHGLLTTDAPAVAGAITARVLAATGARDPLVPQADIAAFHHEMDAAGADWHLLVHGRALHSYTNPDVDGLGDPRMAYDAPAQRLSWAMLVAFLDETMGDAA